MAVLRIVVCDRPFVSGSNCGHTAVLRIAVFVFVFLRGGGRGGLEDPKCSKMVVFRIVVCAIPYV